MMFPLVVDLAADRIPVAVTCRVLGFSKQAFYQWRANPLSQRDWDDAHLINAAIDIHHDDPEFGYRFITDELAGVGITASRNRVNRLCTQQRLFSRHARKRGLHRTPGPPVHDDLVARRFTAPAPDRLWLTDITEHPTTDGKLYLCAIKDACTNRIVGYSMADRMTARLAVDALTNAVALRHPSGTVVHSDRGSQFRSHAYLRALRGASLHGSMGRVGACADNAAMESFFSLLQKNVLDRRVWATREELRIAIVTWIERTLRVPINHPSWSQTWSAVRSRCPGMSGQCPFCQDGARGAGQRGDLAAGAAELAAGSGQWVQRRNAAIHSAPSGGGDGSGRSSNPIACRWAPRRHRATIPLPGRRSRSSTTTSTPRTWVVKGSTR
jgi:putative transposase